MFEIDEAQLAAVCRRYGVKRLALFGSVLRGDAGDDSDIDLLVEFAEPERVGYFTLMETQRALGDVFGRTVDLRTPGELSRHFRDEVVAEARALFEAA